LDTDIQIYEYADMLIYVYKCPLLHWYADILV